MKYTEKLGLKKPESTDYVNIEDINENMDILDEQVGELKEGSTVIEDLQQEIVTHKAENVSSLNGVHGLKIESGTWTPILGWGGNENLNHVYAKQLGFYYLVGKKLFLSFEIELTTKDSFEGSSVMITGLPFPTHHATNFKPVGSLYFEDVELPPSTFNLHLRKPYGNHRLFIQATGSNKPAQNFHSTYIKDNSKIYGSIELIIN